MISGAQEDDQQEIDQKESCFILLSPSWNFLLKPNYNMSGSCWKQA